MGFILTALSIFWGIFTLVLAFIIPFSIISLIIFAPYEMYLGYYKDKHKLPKDFRKFINFRTEYKHAAKFYWQVIRFKKPTF